MTETTLPCYVTVPVALLALLDATVVQTRDFIRDDIDPTAAVVGTLDEVRDCLAPYLLEDPEPPPPPPWLVRLIEAGSSLSRCAEWSDRADVALKGWDQARHDVPKRVMQAVAACRTERESSDGR